MDSIGKHLATSGGVLPRERAYSNLRQVLAERMTLSEAIEAATTIIEAYPNGGRNAGESYIGALAAMLGDYPRQVAMRCADRVHGVVRVCDFLPTPANIVSWCEKELEPLWQRIHREERLSEQFEEQAKHDAIAEDRKRRLSYDELKAKYGDGDGGWGIGATQRKVYPPVRQITKEEMQPTPYLLEVLERQRQSVD